DEGASTRMLIHAGTLIRSGVSERDSCDMTMTYALTDDPDMALAIRELVNAVFAWPVRSSHPHSAGCSPR
ncbi:CbbQ/NirQ/NorQ C-terminal domain-containing protein, partial [Mycobacterium tuberculosis]|uniref:CbbQ/NirQ/NorQ domain-containing protein n=1 Tax=Mycobacterium tuberculosis TaxID=1773 RepID=UPI001ADFA8D9